MNPFTLLAQADVEAFMQQGIPLTVVGVAVVFLALIAILVMLGALQNLGFTDEKPLAPPAKPSPKAVPQAVAAPAPASSSVPAVAPAVPVEEGDFSPELIAVLTAAAIAAVGQPVRIRQVRFVTRGVSPWAHSGRRSIHSSHKLRKRDL